MDRKKELAKHAASEEARLKAFHDEENRLIHILKQFPFYKTLTPAFIKKLAIGRRVEVQVKLNRPVTILDELQFLIDEQNPPKIPVEPSLPPPPSAENLLKRAARQKEIQKEKRQQKKFMEEVVPWSKQKKLKELERPFTKAELDAEEESLFVPEAITKGNIEYAREELRKLGGPIEKPSERLFVLRNGYTEDDLLGKAKSYKKCRKCGLLKS